MTGVMRLVAQRTVTDCGIACLASLVSAPYETVLTAALRLKPTVLERGLSPTQLANVARSLGHRVRVRKRYDLGTVTGIVMVQWALSSPERSETVRGHFVLVQQGALIDPRGPAWWPDALLFLEHRQGVASELVMPEWN